MTRKPKNTSRRTLGDDLEFMALAVASGSTDAPILAQEAAGQREVLFSDVLPVDLNGGKIEDFEALGFTFGPPDPDDPIFRPTTLPGGWSRQGSSHSMWSYLIDEDGYQRIGIFYKAAFYDRSAHMHIERVPRTAAQAKAWEKIDPGREGWRHGENRREGPNYVYQWRGRYGDAAPAGKNAYSDDGRRLEVIVAPDGSVVERREFTVEPEDDGW